MQDSAPAGPKPPADAGAGRVVAKGSIKKQTPMKSLSRLSAFFSVAGISLLLFLSICWVAAFSTATAAWGEAVCFFALTWLCAERLRGRLPLAGIVAAVVLGRVLPELPIHIIDFSGSYYSLIIMVACVAGILLGALCQRERRVAVYALSIFMMLLMNTVVLRAWDGFYANRRGLDPAQLEARATP